MSHENETDMNTELDNLFGLARADRTEVPETVMAAIIADAENNIPPQAQFGRASTGRPAPQFEGWLAGLLSGIGGWRGATALAASACFGLWIGYSSPENAALVGGDYSVVSDLAETDFAFYADIDDLLTEG